MSKKKKPQQKRFRKEVKRQKRLAYREHIQRFGRAIVLKKHLVQADKYPVFEVWLPGTIEGERSQGIGQVFFTRKLPSGEILWSNFLIDSFCLGVKSAFAAIVSETVFREKVEQYTSEVDPGFHLGSPECARKLVQGAVEWAKSGGIKPHPDFYDSKLIFGSVDASLCKESYEYGKDGKHLYIRGPNDGPEQVNEIMNQLARKLGPNGFDCLVPIYGPTKLDNDENDEYEEDFEDGEELEDDEDFDGDDTTEEEEDFEEEEDMGEEENESDGTSEIDGHEGEEEGGRDRDKGHA